MHSSLNATGLHQPQLSEPQAPQTISTSHFPIPIPNSTSSPRVGHSRIPRSVDDNRLSKVMERDEIPINGISRQGSGLDDDSLSHSYSYASSSGYDDSEGSMTFTPNTSLSSYTPSSSFSPALSSWNSYSNSRPRGGSGGQTAQAMERAFTSESLPPIQTETRPNRPGGPLRTPSSTYAPARRPPQVLSINSRRVHSGRRSTRDPNAQYKAQEKAYVQKVRNTPADWVENDPRTPSIGFGTDEETDDESPVAEQHFEDPHDPETLMFYGNEDNLQPSEEELQVQENRERLEWHSMLASVLKGDVVKQEKQRLIGTKEQKTKSELGAEIWVGVRAKYYGRPLQMQKKLLDESRANLGAVIENIITFEIKGETVVGKSPLEQVEEVVANIEKCEWLYSSRKALGQDHARAASDQFEKSCNTVVAWHNITQSINTELGVLQQWVGNPELDFTKQKRSAAKGDLIDDSSFIDRILKEDGLKSLQGPKSLFKAIGDTITKAKSTLTENAAAFAERHLPPYIEELLTLINFPSRLIQEIIKMRLSYAKKMKESAQQSIMIIDQMIEQFQILMKLACRFKQEYLAIASPEPGWDLPPCIDEGFDSTIVEALKFYFKMLNWKLGANKNTFREAEILEQEWGFSNEIGRQLDGGLIEVAEQFSSLTAKSLLRLTVSFEKELRSKPNETSLEMEKRYKAILDSVRVRQLKLFRFSRFLRQRFENATEYNLNMNASQMQEFLESLMMTNHFMIDVGVNGPKGTLFIASAGLWSRPKEIHSLMSTSYTSEDTPEDPTSPYVLILRPEDEVRWEGATMEAEFAELPQDVRVGRLRLVAVSSAQWLQSARLEFANAIGHELDVVIEQRANLSRVNQELGKIKKTTFKLSNTIMESVEVIRAQNDGLASPELIQSCFAFAAEFGKKSLMYMDQNRRMMNNLKLTKLALDWISFICDDCDAADRRTFKWAVVALEFAMAMSRGRSILDISEEDYVRLRSKVGGCMSVLISHFDIMGARSTLAAQQEKNRMDAMIGGSKRLDYHKMRNDDDCCKQMTEQRLAQLEQIDASREDGQLSKTTLGRVLEGQNEADRSLTFLSSSATNITMRWQQGQFVGGGTFGSVYAALNLDTGTLMAVKEIRLQDPQLIPTIVKQISDEMGVLAVLDHPNIVSYYGIEVHRDKVYIFMEYCSGGSVAGLLEHGRIEDETVIMVYVFQMLEGLAYLHSVNIVHRDIKPENVLLDHNGLIKYVDFGAAKIIARQGQTMMAPEPSALHMNDRNGSDGGQANPRQVQKTMTGTPMYMSPEVIRGDSPATSRFSGAADIWSLGCVVLEMATGRRPWATLDNEWAIMYNIAQGNPPQLPTEDQLSAEGIDFLKKCFERDPVKRSTAAELLQHPWIVDFKRWAIDNPEAQTPRSETNSSGGMSLGSRHNSSSS